MKIEAKESQALVDIALKTGGDWPGAWEIARANGLSVTSPMSDGAMVEVMESMAAGTGEGVRVVREYRADGVEPASEAVGGEMACCPVGGIGQMMVGGDFYVEKQVLDK